MLFEDSNESQTSHIAALSQSGLLDTAAGEAFHRLAWLISEVLEAPHCLITLLDGSLFWCRSELDLDSEDVRDGLKPFYQSVVLPEVFECADARIEPDFYDLDLVQRRNGVRFYTGVPIADGVGFQCGVVSIAGPEPRRLTQTERTKLRCFADQVESELKVLSLMQEEANLRFEVSKAFNAKSTFLSQMSHEIRTPIAGIIGATDLLISGMNRDNPDLLNTIRSSATDLLQLLNETLDSAKIEAGGLHIQKQPVDLERLRDKLERHFAVVANSKGLDLHVRYSAEDDLPDFVYSDAMRLRQILFNITHNATKFTQNGGVSCDIMLKRDAGPANGCHLVLRVKDTGMGMSEQQRNALFEPFRQGQEGEDRNFEGTGLGMSLVKQLTDRMGGEIEVLSSPGMGTEIAVSLPVEPVYDTWVATTEERPVPFGQSALTGIPLGPVEGLQVLIADDNPQNRLILDRVLTSWGCETTVAEDGEQALNIARSSSFDAIILDLHMPRRSGFEVASILRQYTSSTKLIACSADTTQGAYAKCQDSGFNILIEKPFDWPLLHRALASEASSFVRTEGCAA